MGNLTNLFATTIASEFDANKAVTINEAFQIIDNSVAGELPISTTGGTTTLSGTPVSPQAQTGFINVSGTLASNAIIEIPVAAGTGRNRVYLVKNGTTGAFTLTVRKVGGTGVLIPQGHTICVFYDGSDIALLTTTPAVIGARAFHSTTQSLTNNTLTAISLDSERFDTNTIHDTSSNNSRLTCKTPGTYLINGTLGYASNATGERATGIRLNGSTYLTFVRQTANTVAETRHNVSTVYVLAAGDYVELIGFQTSGGALNTEQVGNYTPEFMMTRLGS